MKGFLDYRPGTSVLHRLHPLTKLFLSFAVCASSFLSGNPVFLAALIGVDFIIGVLGGVTDRAWSLLKGLLKLSLLLFVLQLCFVQSGQPVLSLPPFRITDSGLLSGVRVALRLTAATMPLALLLSLTKLSDLSNALVKTLRVPPKYAFTLTTAIRFIPVFSNALSAIMEAQTARGVAFDTKNPFKKISLILPLCLPLLVSSVSKIHDSACAAELRGYALRTRESISRVPQFHLNDAATVVFAAALIAAGLLL